MKKITASLFVFAFLFCTGPVSAHEAYVLTDKEFQQGLSVFSPHPLAPLFSPQSFHISLVITLFIIVIYGLSVVWAITPWATFLDKWIKKAGIIGPLVIRFAISASFFAGAMTNAILAPELSLSALAWGQLIRFLLFALSTMIFFGFLTELAALVGLFIFFYVALTFHAYMITYANYFGELVVLFLFGSRFLSLDLLLFGKKAWLGLQNLRHLEIPIVRMLYGIALMYAGWTIKFAHQSLSIAVYNQYHLINFFHAPASFIASGAGLSEITIGFFILVGFRQRLTVLISLVFITLSLLYFREMLWPHFLLYGISFSLIINSGDELTLDRYFIQFAKGLLGMILRKKKKGKQ